MKYILIVALLILTIAARSVHKQKADPLQKCMLKNCRSQALGCSQTQDCTSNLESCGKSLKRDMDVGKFDTCLQKVPTSYALMNCIIEQCSNVQRETTLFEQILKRLN